MSIVDNDPGLLHLLEVDGIKCGQAISVKGGWGTADVIEEQIPSSGTLVKKHPGPPRWEEVELQLDLPVARPVSDWIAASWKRDVQSRHVRVTTVDGTGNFLRVRDFHNALLTATTIPVLDKAFTTVARFLTLRLVPQFTLTESPGGRVPVPSPPRLGPLTPSLQLSYLDYRECTHITRIDEFTVRQAFGSAAAVGSHPWLEPGPLSFPNLTVTLAGTPATSWHRWFVTFVLKAAHDDVYERTGTLTLLDQQEQGLVRIGLFNAGIFQLTGPVYESRRSGDSIDRLTEVVARLYCERMEFTLL